jgi:hypothetical protein
MIITILVFEKFIYYIINEFNTLFTQYNKKKNDFIILYIIKNKK